MNDYLRNITPDSITGMIFALEGVEGMVTLLNGPTGCKYYHSATSDYQSIRQREFDPLRFPEHWYFGQPRIPCTYLDSRDYVYGSGEKLENAIIFLKENIKFDILGIINSPGAALIGDDLERIVSHFLPDKPHAVIETPGFSSNICEGFDSAAVELLRQLNICSKKTRRANAVNVLGISIFHRHHTGDIRELKRLLGMCGIEVNCFICGDCGLETLTKVSEAALNIVIHPEYGTKTAQFLKDRFGTEFYACDGPPIGFDATEKMMEDICGILSRDNAAFFEESEKSRALSYVHISRTHSLTGLPKGVGFSAEGTYSELYSYANVLTRYFGMVLESANVLNGESNLYKTKLEALLSELGFSGALDKSIADANSEIIFANGNTISQLKLLGKHFCGVEISLPSLGYVDVLPKAALGLLGALMLTEQVLNGLLFR